MWRNLTESAIERARTRRRTRRQTARPTSRPRHRAIWSAGVLAASTLGWVATTAGAAGGLALEQPSDPYLGKISPTADAHVKGMYARVVSWPLVSIHASVSQNGDLITYGTPLNTKKQGALLFDHWDPARNRHTQSPMMAVDSFCNINVPTTGGRLMMAGGNSQTTSGTYDINARTYTALPNFAFPRWYASMIRMPDGRFVVMGGAEPKAKEGEPESRFASTPEILTPGAPNWKQLTGAKSVPLFGSPDYAWWYPKAYLAPSGNVFGVSQERMWVLDPDAGNGNGSITDVGRVPGTGFGSSASSVMFEPGKILLAGGGQHINDDGLPGSRDAAVIDISTDLPSTAPTARMARPRNWLNLTVLPNGEVLASGGTEVGLEGTPAKTNEIWNPTTGQWRTLAAGIKIRTYHSTAVLLPSGTIYSGGGGVPGPVNNLNSEFFLPPQLFERVNGQVRWADRPEFREVSGTIAHGGTATFGMKDNRGLASVSLTSVGSVTHSYNADQRRVPLAFSQSGSTVNVSFPNDANTLPPGLYLLHAVDGDGVPAPSQIVEIMQDGSPGVITVYGSGPEIPPTSPTGPTTTMTTTTTTTTTTTVPPVGGGLVGSWDMDEGSGSTVADSSGNGNDGSLRKGVAFAPGRSGTGTSHSGAKNQHVRVAPSGSLDTIRNQFTAAAWVRPTAPGASYHQGVVTRQYRTAGKDQWYLGLRNGYPTAVVNTSNGGNRRVTGPTKVTSGAWTHLAATYDGGVLRLFVDGVEVKSAAKTGAIRFDGNRPVIIGANQNNSGNSAAQQRFRGVIDEVRLHSAAVSAAEVADLAGGLPPATTTTTTTPVTTTTVPGATTTTTTTVPGTTTTTVPPAAGAPVAAWSLDETGGTTASDSSGNGNDGVLLNGVQFVGGRSGNATSHSGGSNEHVRVPASASLDSTRDGFTLAASINPSDIKGSYNQGVLTRQYRTGGNDQWYLGIRNGFPIVSVNTSVGGVKVLQAPSKVQEGQWVHVAGTFDGSRLRLYVDGVEVASVAKSGAMRFDGSRPVILGGNQNNSGADEAQYLFRGLLDDATVYAEALAAAEIAALAGA